MRPLAVDVTAGPRAQILACIEAMPGIHLRSVERETSLPLGQVLYHLDRLERMDVIVSARDAVFRRYYPAASVGRAEKRFLAALRHEIPRHVLLALLASPRLQHKELQDRLSIAASTLSFHLQRLVDSGVLARERVGAAHFYSITRPDIVRADLLAYREGFRDPAVDRFARAEDQRDLS